MGVMFGDREQTQTCFIRAAIPPINMSALLLRLERGTHTLTRTHIRTHTHSDTPTKALSKPHLEMDCETAWGTVCEQGGRWANQGPLVLPPLRTENRGTG